MRDRRSRLAIKVDAVQREFMWRCLSKHVPYYLVTEYPKSGGSWFGQMLSTYVEIPFIRNSRPPLFPLRPMLLHSHRLHSPHFANVFCLLRDGRDVMVSAYWHWLHHNDRNTPWAVEKHRRELPFEDFDDVQQNLPRFIDYMFTKEARGRFHFRYDEFVFSWLDKDAPIVKYEALLEDAPTALANALKQSIDKRPDMTRLKEIAEEFSFRNQAKRQPGKENRGTFLRKGIAGDWKNVFSKEACEVFDRYAGEALIAAGYEADRSWIETCSTS